MLVLTTYFQLMCCSLVHSVKKLAKTTGYIKVAQFSVRLTAPSYFRKCVAASAKTTGGWGRRVEFTLVNRTRCPYHQVAMDQAF